MTADNPGFFCLASACLCGVSCRYDGRASTVEELAKLHEENRILAICPEVDGGLPVPRPPCELRNGRAVTREGMDVTDQFQAGAALALKLARAHGIRVAVLKENSPSCGGAMVYDGTFSGRRVPGRGITADMLLRHGIRIVSEHTFQEAFRELLREKNKGSAD